jgi:hypothetical protein
VLLLDESIALAERKDVDLVALDDALFRQALATRNLSRQLSASSLWQKPLQP